MRIDGLLDTNIVIDLLRGETSAVKWHANLTRLTLAITPIVWMEVIQGARNKAERARIMRFLYKFRIEHPTDDDNRWAMLQVAKFSLSHGVDWADVMIASIAVRLTTPLYTRNIKHFVPLPDVDERRPY